MTSILGPVLIYIYPIKEYKNLSLKCSLNNQSLRRYYLTDGRSASFMELSDTITSIFFAKMNIL